MWKRDGSRVRAALVLTIVLWSLPAAATVSGSFWYAVDNIKSVTADAQVLVWAAVPPQWHGQTVTVTNITPAPVAILDDEATGNRIIEWLVTPAPWEALPEIEPAQIFFHYDIELQEKTVRHEIDPAAVVPADPGSPLVERYTAAEMFIQTDGAVRDRALKIIGDQTNPYLQARAIYGWLVDNLQFAPGQTGSPDALTTLTARQGDCNQFSLLFTAMCRALGIPARTVTAAWTGGGMHVFAEFHLQGFGWIPVDISLAQILLPDGAGLSPAEVASYMAARNVPVDDRDWFFGNLCDQRLVTTVGNNLSFDSPTLGHQVMFARLAPAGVDAIPEACRIEGLNEDIVQGGFFVFGQEVTDEEQAHALTHQRLAKEFFRVELYEVVADGCRSTLELANDGVQPWINMGKVYMHKGEYYKAESAFKRAMQGVAVQRGEKLESLIWTHNYLGNCYDMLGHRDLALQEYDLVVEMANNYRGAVDYARKYIERPFDRAPAGN